MPHFYILQIHCALIGLNIVPLIVIPRSGIYLRFILHLGSPRRAPCTIWMFVRQYRPAYKANSEMAARLQGHEAAHEEIILRAAWQATWLLLLSSDLQMAHVHTRLRTRSLINIDEAIYRCRPWFRESSIKEWWSVLPKKNKKESG